SLESILTQANRSLIDMNLSYEDLVRQLEQAIAETEAMAAKLDEKNRELQRISITDALTGLPNRRELFRRLTAEVLRLARHGGPMAMLVADIDHFKKVNDTWGHVFGDTVLKQVANALRKCCRESDLVARTGGEEFAALLPDTDLSGASYVARRMLELVETTTLEAPDGRTINVTISVGIAWLQGPCRPQFDSEALVTRLYNTADQALYRSKTSGRNRATRYPQALVWTSADETPA
ncbi:MAG: GGDEF domain-containing protein, partial [Myxococcota bacterium]